MSKKVMVFGAGLVGNAIARDIHRSGMQDTSVELNELAPRFPSRIRNQCYKSRFQGFCLT